MAQAEIRGRDGPYFRVINLLSSYSFPFFYGFDIASLPINTGCLPEVEVSSSESYVSEPGSCHLRALSKTGTISVSNSLTLLLCILCRVRF